MENKTFENFKLLFDDAYNNGVFALLSENPSINETAKAAMECRYSFIFNVWLQETKGWKYGNEEKYKTFLTREFFDEFISHRAENLNNQRLAIEKARQERKDKILKNAGLKIDTKNGKIDTGNNRKTRLKRSEYLDLGICEFIEHVYKHGMSDFEMMDWIKNTCNGDKGKIQTLYEEVESGMIDGADWGRVEYNDGRCLYEDESDSIRFLEVFLSIIETEANNAGVILDHQINIEKTKGKELCTNNQVTRRNRD